MPSFDHQSSDQRLQFIFAALDGGSLSGVQNLFNALHPAEIADLLEASPPGRRELLWELVAQENEGEVLIELSDDVRARLVEEMDTGEIVDAIKTLDEDDIADFLQALPDTLIHQTLAGMDRQDRERVSKVLAYNEDTAGGLMDTNTITVRPDVNIDVVMRYLRRLDQLPGHTDNLIVVSRYDQFLGVLPISTLLTAQAEERVADLMDQVQKPISAETPSTNVARLFEDHNLISAPVVDHVGKLIGRITVDDVVDIIREEADHSMMSMAGLDDEEDLFAPVLISSKRRAIWLGTNLITALLAAWVISHFEATLERTVALAILMGVIPSMGGVAGTQTLTLVIRGLALGQIGQYNFKSLFSKEVLVSSLNGIAWAGVIFVATFFAFSDLKISFIIGAAMLINLVTAASCGVFLPILNAPLQHRPCSGRRRCTDHNY